MDQQKPAVDYLRLLRRVVVHRWAIIVVAFVAVAVPMLGYTLFATDDTYEASATLFLVPERSDPGFLRDFMAPQANALYQVLLRSRSLAQAVTEALPKDSRDELARRMTSRDYLLAVMNTIRRWRGQEVVVYSPSELAVRELQETRMAFEIKKDGTVVVTASAFNPRVAVDLANTYVDVLLSRSTGFARQQARSTRELLENQIEQARAAQVEAEDALRKFQTQSGVVKLPEEVRTDLQLLSQLESQLADVQVNRDIAKNRLAYLKGEQKDSSQAGVDPAVQALRERAADVGAKLAALTEKYTEQHPLVRATQAELDETQQRMKAALQGQQVPRPGGAAVKPHESAQASKQMADLEVEILGLQVRESGLQQRIARLKKATAVMGTREQEYSRLARSVETQLRLTTTLSEKLTGARISEQTHIRNIQVIDLATLPRQPSPKPLLRRLLLGLLGGLALGLGLALLREYSTQVIETEQEVATQGLPILGSIPLAPRTEGVPVTVPVVFVATSESHSLPADSCRAIRTAIDCRSLDMPIRTVLVTSPGAHEGKSTVVVNLALAFAEAGRRVLVIDGDLRRGALHQALGVPNEIGLTDVLNGRMEWPEACRTVRPDLQFIPSGAKAQNPAGLLSSRRMAIILEQARERADVILIDSPPVLAVSDALPLTAHVDGVLLVARFGATQRRSLARAKEQLARVGARIVGVVVNGLSRRETRRYYAEYDHYAAAGASGRKRKRRRMKALFMSALVALSLGASASLGAAQQQEEYRIGTEDVLHVIVWDNKDLEQTVTVRPDGKISYPLAGEIQAQGRTVPELSQILTERLSTAVKNPNVSVMVKEIRSFRVHFVGKVAKPGVYPIKAGTPLLQALTLAGGPSEHADLPAAYVIRGEAKIPVDLRKLIQDGDLSKNIKLDREDTIVIPEISIGTNPQEVLDRRIYLLGKIVKPGVYSIKKDLPILHALFLAGGIAEGGDMAAAFVIRGKDKIPVDLWRLTQKGDLSQNVTITAEDTIVVPAGGELQNAVYVMGEVNKPGVYSQPEALSLLKLVALAGGFTKYAAPGRATLIRRNGDQRVLMKIDLKDIMNDPQSHEDLGLRPGDVLIVPERLF